MKSIVGLLEYTVTGAFVWIMFVVFLTLVGADVWGGWFKSFPSVRPELLKSSEILKEVLSLAIGGVFLVVVFSTGYLLDLVAPLVFSVLEIRWAKIWLLGESRPWLDKLIADQGALVSSDYRDLTRKKGNINQPVVWKVEKYRRVTMFLLSYVLATSKGGQLGDLLDRLKVWRVSQAISLSLIVLLLALVVWISATAEQRQSLEARAVGIVLPLVLFALSYLSMRMTFFRLVIALEAAAYIGWTQAQRSPEVQSKPQLAAEPEELPQGT